LALASEIEDKKSYDDQLILLLRNDRSYLLDRKVFSPPIIREETTKHSEQDMVDMN
jgi:hypothetical protein